MNLDRNATSESGNPDLVSDFFAREREAVSSQPATDGTWEEILAAARPRRRWTATFAGAAAILLLGAGVWGSQQFGGTRVGPASTAPPQTSVSTSAPTSSGPTAYATTSARTSTAPTTTKMATAPAAALSVPRGAVVRSVSPTADGTLVGVVAGRCGGDPCDVVAMSGDEGRSWQARSRLPRLGLTNLGELRFIDSARGFVYGWGLSATVDGGRTWQIVDVGGARVLSLQISGDRAWFATDDGSAFQVAFGSRQPKRVSIPAVATGTNIFNAWLVADGSTMYLDRVKVGTGGTPLDPVRLNHPQAGFSRPGGCVSPADLTVAPVPGREGTLFSLCPDGPVGTYPSGYQVNVSTTGGETWTGRGYGLGPVTATPPLVAAVDGRTLLAATSSGASSGRTVPAQLLRSTDAGATWKPVQGAPAGGWSFLESAVGGLVYGLSDGTLYVSHDGGRTFAARHSS